MEAASVVARTDGSYIGCTDAGLMRFYRVLQGRTGELLERLAPIAYTEANFEWSKGEAIPGDALDADLDTGGTVAGQDL